MVDQLRDHPLLEVCEGNHLQLGTSASSHGGHNPCTASDVRHHQHSKEKGCTGQEQAPEAMEMQGAVTPHY